MIAVFSLPCYIGPGTFAWECRIHEFRAMRAFFVILLALYLFFWVKVGIRVRANDNSLKREFAQQWDEWSEKVPSKVIPWVY